MVLTINAQLIDSAPTSAANVQRRPVPERNKLLPQPAAPTKHIAMPTAAAAAVRFARPVALNCTAQLLRKMEYPRQ